MLITPTITQANGIISVSLAATFTGDTNDATDKANILAFGDPNVNLTGGNFVDNNAVLATQATFTWQDVTFKCSTTGNGGNQVTIQFVAQGSPDVNVVANITNIDLTSNLVTVTANNSFVTGQRVRIAGLSGATFLNGQTLTVVTPGSTSFTATFVHSPDYPSAVDSGTATSLGAIQVSGDVIAVDILPVSGPTRTTAQFVTLFGTVQPTTTDGGIITATGGSTTTATTGGPFIFTGGSPTFNASFLFNFPASDLYVGVSTQLQGYTARFMTQLPPPPLGIPNSQAGPLDCVTSDPQHAARYWITTIEGRISSLMVALRQKTALGPQSPVHV